MQSRRNGKKLSRDKSIVSRLEAGKLGKESTAQYAREYCAAFQLSAQQTEQLLRGEKIALPDTSALLKNPQLIDALNEEYSVVIIPRIVVDELDYLKNKGGQALAKKAWEVLRGISYGPRAIYKEYQGKENGINNDSKIIKIAEAAALQYHAKVDIITNDIDYSAYLKGHASVSALHLKEYLQTKQAMIDTEKLKQIAAYYDTQYQSLGALTPAEANAYLPDGNTLLIAAVRSKAPIRHRKAKILWLVSQGADINQRDCSRRYFPPLSHAVQKGDYEIFKFLLRRCAANPNVGSRDPRSSTKVRQKNEGNMPLMVAAWSGKTQFVTALCADERTSLNQQDANGFTALIKACANGKMACREVLLRHGADEKIVDIDGKTAQDHLQNYQQSGALVHKTQRKRKGKI